MLKQTDADVARNTSTPMDGPTLDDQVQTVSQSLDPAIPLVVFSHLRWDFVRQRPQHIVSRFARGRAVWVWEEMIPCDHPLPYLEYHHFSADNVTSLRPRVPHWFAPAERDAALAELYRLFARQSLRAEPVLWYYTPAMLSFTGDAAARAVVYDCMDELSAFAGADPALVAQEARLLERADVVFTGGRSLYEAKRQRHGNVHAFPSAVDVAHFATARGIARPANPAGERVIGYYGVIDERIDLALIAGVAAAHPGWRIEMVGPVVKIDPASLPKAANIVWAGSRSYAQLPETLARWDAAIMPFALNEATRFISPTKTPEYLAGGKPVVSTPIADVVAQYGGVTGVWIAGDAASFGAALEEAFALAERGNWTAQADALLETMSWDATQTAMARLLAEAVARRDRGEPVPGLVQTLAPKRAQSGSPGVIGKTERYDVLVVGAGFAGAVMAERLANDAGKRVLVIDRRDHIAGNAYDHLDEAGVMIHRYGPHIFHTNSDDVFAYLSRFTRWRPYEHRVLGVVRDKLVPIPINRTTLEGLYGIDLPDDESAAAFLAARAEPRDPIRTSEDVVVNAVGQELYELFFRGYTRKMWNLDPSQLDRQVTARVPTRTDRDDRYFQDRHQQMPADGYTALFERMLDHPNITVRTGVDFAELRDAPPADHIVYTGPIDEFFDFRFGKLPYRSLRFQHETHPVEQYQPVAVVNYPSEDVPFTRITEYKQLTGQEHPHTSISYEFPCADGDPYYPIPREENQELFRRYDALARETPGVTFVGRLASYRYYNMDQVVGQALATYRRLRGAMPAGATPASQTAERATRELA